MLPTEIRKLSSPAYSFFHFLFTCFFWFFLLLLFLLFFVFCFVFASSQCLDARELLLKFVLPTTPVMKRIRDELAQNLAAPLDRAPFFRCLINMHQDNNLLTQVVFREIRAQLAQDDNVGAIFSTAFSQTYELVLQFARRDARALVKDFDTMLQFVFQLLEIHRPLISLFVRSLALALSRSLLFSLYPPCF